MGHTPTPWRLFDENGVLAIKSSERQSHNEVIFWTGFDGSHYPKANRANAALIVRAVNSHAELVKALEEIERGTVAVLLDAELNEQPVSRDVLKAILEQVRSALSLSGCAGREG